MNNQSPPLQTTDNEKGVVLLVDDHDEVRTIVARALLGRNGCCVKVLHANNALTALSILEKTRIDVVVADERMPGPTGMKLLDTVKQSWPETRRVLFTAYATSDQVVSGVADEVLGKTLDLWRIVQVICRLVRGRG